MSLSFVRAVTLCQSLRAGVRFTVPQRRRAHSSIPPEAQWSVQQLVSRSTSGESGKATPVAQSTVEHLARLTHLPLSPTEVDAVRREIEGLLHFVAIVQDVDTTGVEPLDTLLEDAPLKLRDDTPVQRATVEGMLRNAPETFEGFYVAPKELHFEQQHAESDDNSDGGNDDDSATATTTTTTTSHNNINKKGSGSDSAL